MNNNIILWITSELYSINNIITDLLGIMYIVLLYDTKVKCSTMIVEYSEDSVVIRGAIVESWNWLDQIIDGVIRWKRAMFFIFCMLVTAMRVCSVDLMLRLDLNRKFMFKLNHSTVARFGTMNLAYAF